MGRGRQGDGDRERETGRWERETGRWEMERGLEGLKIKVPAEKGKD